MLKRHNKTGDGCLKVLPSLTITHIRLRADFACDIIVADNIGDWYIVLCHKIFHNINNFYPCKTHNHESVKITPKKNSSAFYCQGALKFLYVLLLCCCPIPEVYPEDYPAQLGAVLPFDCCCSLKAFLLMSMYTSAI